MLEPARRRARPRPTLFVQRTSHTFATLHGV